MDETQVKPPNHDTVGTVTGPLSRGGPEVPPDVADSPIAPVGAPALGNEPTVLLPVIHPAPKGPGFSAPSEGPGAGGSTAPQGPGFSAPSEGPGAGGSTAPKVEARAVIIYEPEPRRRRGLWVFTALLVALTAGVVLGQAAAYQPAYRSLPTAQTEPVPSYVPPPAVMPSPPGPASPLPGHRITAPLGSATKRLIEVTGAGTPLRIGSAELGDLLFSVATVDGSIIPTVVDTSRGPRLSLAQAGAVAGATGTEVQLNAKVRWTVRLTGGSAEQVIDMRAGGLAGIDLTGDAARVVLELPRATGTLALRITGTVGDLRIRAGDGVPVRLRLVKGADSVTLDTAPRRNVRSGTTVLSRGWRSATDRYDISMSGKVGSVLVERAP